MGQLRWLRNPKKSWSVLLTVTSLITSILGGLSPDPVDEAGSGREILFDALTLRLSGDSIEYQPGAVAYTLWGIKPSEPALAQVNLAWQDLLDTTLEASWVLAAYDGDGEESYVTGESIRDLAGKGDHTLQIPLHQAHDAELQTLAIEVSLQRGDQADTYYQLITFVSGLTAYDMRRAASDYFGQDPFVGLDGTASFCKAGVDPFVEGTQWDDSSGLSLIYSYLPADCQLFVEHGAQALFLAGSQQAIDPCAVLDGIDLQTPCIEDPPEVDPCQAVDRNPPPGCGGSIPCTRDDQETQAQQSQDDPLSGVEVFVLPGEVCGIPVPDPCDGALLSRLPGCGGSIPCTRDDQETQAQQSQNDPLSDVELIVLPGEVCGIPVPHPCDVIGDEVNLQEPLPGCGGSIPCTGDDQEMQVQQSEDDPLREFDIIPLPGEICGIPVPHPCDVIGDEVKLQEPLPGCGGPIPCTGSGDESASNEPSFAEIDPGLIIPDEVCGVPLGLCPMLSYLGMTEPVFCQEEFWDGFGECESCNGLAQQVDDALEDTVLPTVVPILSETKQALGGGRWSISLMQESLSAFTPYDGDPGPVAAVGSLSIDVPDSGSIYQDSKLLPGKWRLDDQVAPDTGANNAEKWTMTAFCGAAVIGTVVAAFFTVGGAVAVGGPMIIGFCTAAAFQWADTGYIACGIEPWGVQWGPQNVVSNLFGIDAGSNGPATTTAYFDQNRNETDSGAYILIYNGPGYDKGEQACKTADWNSEQAARAAANQYGSTAGGGDASIDVMVELPIQLWDIDLIYDLGGGLLFSPTQGLAVACDGGAGCPTQIGLSVSQCGAVTVKGGTPAEVTYLFQGGPHEDEPCPLNVNVHIGDDDESIEVPALALSVQYEGAGQ